MCDCKCFFHDSNEIDTEINFFLTEVLAVQKYIIDDLTTSLGIVKQKVFEVTSYGLAFKATTKATMVIKNNYIQYILTYGIPPDGNFDPVKLAEFDP